MEGTTLIGGPYAPYTPNTGSNINVTEAIGDGKTAVIIEIDLGLALTAANGLIGASISMNRI